MKQVITMLVMILGLGVLPRPSLAIDETWIITQAHWTYGNNHHFMLDYVRRDQGAPYTRPFRDLYRFNWGIQQDKWTYHIGAAYSDFRIKEQEFRLHQYVTRQFDYENYFDGFLRMGLEQRKFQGDPTVYLRTRHRLQFHFMRNWLVNPTIYNEFFYSAQEGHVFASNINENRLGAGLRIKGQDWNLFLFYVQASLHRREEGLSSPTWFKMVWIQDF